MENYLSKPIDEHLLNIKIAQLVKKPLVQEHAEQKKKGVKIKYINLSKMFDLGKSKSDLILEIIAVYCFSALIQNYASSAQDFQFLQIIYAVFARVFHPKQSPQNV